MSQVSRKRAANRSKSRSSRNSQNSNEFFSSFCVPQTEERATILRLSVSWRRNHWNSFFSYFLLQIPPLPIFSPLLALLHRVAQRRLYCQNYSEQTSAHQQLVCQLGNYVVAWGCHTLLR